MGRLMLFVSLLTLAPRARGAEVCEDPFAPDGVIPAGRYKGLTIDVSQVRSVRALTAEEAAPYDPRDGETLLANFQHAGHWWIARLPEDAVRDVVFQSEDIPGGFGHGQIRFVLKPGKELQLIPQCRDELVSTLGVGDLLWTAFGTPPAGVEHDDAGRFGENHVAAYRLMSMEDDLKIMSGDGTLHSVEQFNLRLSETDKQRVLETAIRMAGDAGLGRMFNLLNRSCVSEALAVLDRTLSYGLPQRAASQVFGHIPHWIPFYLELRGLAGPKDKLPNLREEFPGR